MRCTLPALYAMVQRRQIPYIRIGRRLRFRHEDLDRFLGERLVEPEHGPGPDGRQP